MLRMIHIIWYAIFPILVDLHSQEWINILFFEYSISHIFISIIKFSFFLTFRAVLHLKYPTI